MSKQYFNEWRKATRGVNPTTSESEEEGESDSSESQIITLEQGKKTSKSKRKKPTDPKKAQNQK